MDLVGEFKIKQEQIDDDQLDGLESIATSRTSDLTTQCIEIASDDQSDIIPLTRPPSNADGLNMLTKESDSQLHVATNHAQLTCQTTTQDICLNEPCNDFIPSPTTTIDLSSMQDVAPGDLPLNTTITSANESTAGDHISPAPLDQDTLLAQSPTTSEKRKRSDDEDQVSQPIKKATGNDLKSAQ